MQRYQVWYDDGTKGQMHERASDAKAELKMDARSGKVMVQHITL